LGYRCLSPLCVFSLSSLCVHLFLQIFPFNGIFWIKGPSNSSVTSWTDCVGNDPIPKQGHILRSWRLGPHAYSWGGRERVWPNSITCHFNEMSRICKSVESEGRLVTAQDQGSWWGVKCDCS
jgi:hypothetical protein